MTDVVTALNELSQVFETTATRSAVTIAALAVLLGIGWLSTQVQTWLRERLSDVTADLVTLVVVGSAFASAVGVTLGVWRLADDVERALANLPGGQDTGPLLAATVVVLVVTHLVSRAGRRLVDSLVQRRDDVDQHQVEVTYRVVQIGLWLTAIAVVLGLWRVDLTGLLVGAGFLGIVVGMAARQTLGAVLAGFILMFARPFEIGDWVEIGDREGIVTDISIVNTRVQTFDGEYVMIPNDLVSGQEVINRSRKGRLRIEVEVGVDYDTDLQTATRLAGEAMDDLDAILSVPTPQVVVKRFDDSAIVIGCRFWIDKPSARRKWRARTAVIQSLKAHFDDAGVKIPFPQRELSGRAEQGGFRHATATETVEHVEDDDHMEPAEAEPADVDPDAAVEPTEETVATPDAVGATDRAFGENQFVSGGDSDGEMGTTESANPSSESSDDDASRTDDDADEPAADEDTVAEESVAEDAPDEDSTDASDDSSDVDDAGEGRGGSS
jgi:small conductance mechanosensitive channel